MSQTWRINGQTYTHGQLMELKRQGFDPRKDKIVLAGVTPRKPNPAKVEEPAVAPAKVEKVEEGAKLEVEHNEPLPTNFGKLKKLAREAGMEVANDTTKAEILAFLGKE